MDQNPNQESQLTPKQQVVERVRDAANVLVTVRSNPNVDELAATIGLTLMLNKLGKHATAVFSGQVPSTLEFLKPEETIETNTDSLRDFIVSLDKSKADKLRYKVEENVVKIFITPYRTSISEKDLEFTQGDFNVDVVLALGVTAREELDQAITAHGRILHDATVVTVTAGQHESQLGAINWQDAAASSLSEMLVSISEAFQGGIIDEQMATAFLTGIVAETERFSNTKTSPKVMTMAAQLMAAGANQQLIANELDKVRDLPMDQPASVPHDDVPPPPPAEDDGSLTISHDKSSDKSQGQDGHENQDNEPADQQPKPEQGDTERFLPPLPQEEAGESFEPLLADDPHSHTDQQGTTDEAAEHHEETGQDEQQKENQIHIDEHGNIVKPDRPLAPKHKVIEPLSQPEPNLQGPSLDDQLAGLSDMLKASSQPDFSNAHITDVKATDPADPLPESESVPELDLPTLPGMPDQGQPAPSEPPAPPAPEPVAPPAPPAPEPPAPEEPPMPQPDTTLLDIEKSVHSPHVEGAAQPQDEAADLDNARNAVMEAISQAGLDPNRPEPRADSGAPILGVPSHDDQAAAPAMPTINGFDPSAPQEGQPQEHDNQLPPPPPIPPPMMPGSFPPA